MNLREYKTDLERETGESLSMAAARVLFSQYQEHEAEAIAGGRDDVAPIDEPKRYHSDSCWYAMGRGSECLCGLIPFDESYHDGEMESIAAEWFPSTLTQEIANRSKVVGHHWTPGKSLRCDECGDEFDPKFWLKHQLKENKLVCNGTADDLPF